MLVQIPQRVFAGGVQALHLFAPRVGPIIVEVFGHGAGRFVVSFNGSNVNAIQPLALLTRLWVRRASCGLATPDPEGHL
jgi:hypothetical protein